MKPNYGCSQDELYTGEGLCIKSYEAEQAKFADEKPKYTVPYAAALKAELNAARAIPDMTQRLSANTGKRIVLMRKLKAPEESMEPAEGEKNFDRLRSYINTAYSGDKALRKARLSEAGFDEYELVMECNWEKVESFLSKTNDFVNFYEADLLANDNMPPTFKAAYNTLATGLLEDVGVFLDEQENIEQITQQKIVANNALHKKMNELRADGQNIFKRDVAKKAQFVWTSILEEVTPPGAAGLRGTVKDSVLFVPVVGALIEMQLPETPAVSFVTDENGVFYSGNLTVGTYSFKLSKSGYVTLEMEVVIKTGTTSFKHLMMSTGGGEEIEQEGEFDAGVINNIDFGDVDADDASIRLEAVGTTVSYFASSSPTGGQTGPVVTVNSGVPVLMKLSVFVAMIGLGGVNGFLNAQNIGSGSGGWKVTLIIA